MPKQTRVETKAPSAGVLFVALTHSVDPVIAARLAFACSVWNTALGRPVLVMPAPGTVAPRVDVWVTPVLGYRDKEMMAQTCPTGYESKFITFRVDLPNNVELTKVLVHELGHALGLPHNKSKGSVMYYRIEGAGWPNATDVKRLSQLWLP